MSPEIGSCTLEIVLNKVDFPIPFLPKTVTSFPFSISKLILEAITLWSFFC
ncbi:hypothetical protein [Polaribacter sp. SA4-12]|uniref:hypothetical protein n=1 Tax=Polaribacter sp. SA4-12 TaxID=1312072 RepID=UPI0030024520